MAPDPNSPVAPTPASPSITDALGGLVTSLDVKALAGVLTAVLALLAGRMGWTWLTPELADKIALVICAKGIAALAAHAHITATQIKSGAPS